MNRLLSLLLLACIVSLCGCVHREHFRPVHHARTSFATAAHASTGSPCDPDDVEVSPLALPFFEDPYFIGSRAYRVRGCGQQQDVECTAFGDASGACSVVHPYETPPPSVPTAIVRVVTEYGAPRAAREVLQLGVDGRVVRPSSAPALGLPVTATPGTYSFDAALLETYLEHRSHYETWSCGTRRECSGFVTRSYRRVRLAQPCSASVPFAPQPGGSYRFVVRHQPGGTCAVQCVRDDGGYDRACERPLSTTPPTVAATLRSMSSPAGR